MAFSDAERHIGSTLSRVIPSYSALKFTPVLGQNMGQSQHRYAEDVPR
jgi:hypothetical protein